MPRTPAKASGKPGIQTQLLRHLAQRRVCLSVDELAVEMQTFSRRDIAKAAGKLVARDMIARKRTGCYVVTLHGKAAAASDLEIKSGPRGPMTGQRAGANSFQARLWRALRSQNKGTLNDFIALAEPGAMKNPHNSADQYFRALTLAGYVSVLARRRPGTAPTSPGFKVFVLIKNTGPRSPRLAKACKFVRDMNSGESFDISGGGDENS